jgi:hypothetical protein
MCEQTDNYVKSIERKRLYSSDLSRDGNITPHNSQLHIITPPSEESETATNMTMLSFKTSAIDFHRTSCDRCSYAPVVEVARLRADWLAIPEFFPAGQVAEFGYTACKVN